MIEIRNVTKSIHERTILNEINLQIAEGQLFALLGPNGAGKTTLMRVMMNVLAPNQGTVKIFNQTLTEQTSAIIKSQIGVQNDGNLYDKLTVQQNLMIWGELYGMSKALIKQRSQELLKFFDLYEHRQRKVSALSKGMKQKVALTRAILHHPRLLILDEPTSGLDPKSIEDFMMYLKKLVHQQKMTIVMCTHQLDGLENIVDHLAILYQNKIQISGNVQQLIAQYFPQNNYHITIKDDNFNHQTLQSFGNYVLNKNIINIMLHEGIHIYEVVNHLVAQQVKILEVMQVQHTIKDLYFKVLSQVEED